MVLDQLSNTVRWQPRASQTGFNEVELMVFDDFGGSGTQEFTIAVIDSSRLQVDATDGIFKNHVQVNFNLIDGATRYRVFRCPDAGETCGLPVGYTRNGLFNDMKGMSGILYHYRVRACTKTRCGDLSAADIGYASIAPARPTGIRASDGGFNDRIRVGFNPVDGAIRYRVFRCMDKGQTCGLPVGFPQDTSFDDKGVEPGLTYYFRVKACNSQHCGEFSVANPGYSSP